MSKSLLGRVTDWQQETRGLFSSLSDAGLIVWAFIGCASENRPDQSIPTPVLRYAAFARRNGPFLWGFCDP
jgi:hypothetical protein